MEILRYWQPHHYACVGEFNVKNQSPTCQSCRRHKPSPTSVTNIDTPLLFVYYLAILNLPQSYYDSSFSISLQKSYAPRDSFYILSDIFVS